jgi:transposase
MLVHPAHDRHEHFQVSDGRDREEPAIRVWIVLGIFNDLFPLIEVGRAQQFDRADHRLLYRPADLIPQARRPARTAARSLAENPDATRDIYAERCACGAALEEAGQELARAWDHVDLPPIKPITTRINLLRTICPCCKARVTAQAPADMPEGSPFGPGIKAAVAYLHGCQMVGFKRLTELCEGLFGLTISQGAISNVLARMGKPFGAAAEQIAATVRASEVIASD